MLKQYFMLMPVLIWSGCIIAISCMESWLKFRAPGVTLPVGLGIGKLVFNALNKMEWAFALIIAVAWFLNKQQVESSFLILFGLAVCILTIQTFWLLPSLDARADVVISRQTLPPSLLHWYFIGGEIIKLVSLIVIGFRLFKGFVLAE